MLLKLEKGDEKAGLRTVLGIFMLALGAVCILVVVALRRVPWRVVALLLLFIPLPLVWALWRVPLAFLAVLVVFLRVWARGRLALLAVLIVFLRIRTAGVLALLAVFVVLLGVRATGILAFLGMFVVLLGMGAIRLVCLTFLLMFVVLGVVGTNTFPLDPVVFIPFAFPPVCTPHERIGGWIWKCSCANRQKGNGEDSCQLHCGNQRRLKNVM